MYKFVDIQQVGEFKATAFDDGTLSIYEDFGDTLNIPIGILLFFVQEYQKHFPIQVRVADGKWCGISGESEDI